MRAAEKAAAEPKGRPGKPKVSKKVRRAKGTVDSVVLPTGKTAIRSKKPVSIRLDQDIIDHYKAGGEGWQSRINAALRDAAGLKS